MKKIIQNIPNFITILNLLSGVLAIYFAIEGHLVWAGIFISVAAILDFFDGFAATILKAKSEIGVQLDSLADVISFGVAPGAIIFTLIEFSILKVNRPIFEISANISQWLLIFSSLLIPAAAAIRLAKFNSTEQPKGYFLGLAVPANALFWAGMGLMIERPISPELNSVLYSTESLIIFTLIFSLLMVSNLPMFSFKVFNFSLKSNWYRYILIVFSVAFILLFNFFGLILSILFYILLNFIIYFTSVKLSS